MKLILNYWILLRPLLRRLTWLALTIPAGPTSLLAQEAGGESPHRDFGVEGYAVANYYSFDWQTDPRRRNALDLERFTVEPSYRVNDRLRFEAEIEFEHGGTGTAVEFDPFEEFGEFETETEKGGEVVIEKLQVEYQPRPSFGIRAGRLYVPVGLLSSHDEPDEYFTNARNETEVALIPTLWHETGVGVFGDLGRLRYQALLVSGLDATGFSSANWVVGGWQKRFETANANGLAAVGRLDLALTGSSYVGVSGYISNSAANRPKADVTFPAHVTIVDAHAVIERGPFRARGMVLYGHLQNAGPVSDANRNLSNNLGVARTPVGSAALGWFAEAGYDVLSLLSHTADRSRRLDLYARYDWYDSMYRVSGGVFDNPRWERHTLSAGVNWVVHPTVILKGQYAHRTLGLTSLNRENTVALGLGFLYGE